MAIVQYCRSGSRPRPSPTSVIPRPAASILNGLATKVLRIRKKPSVVMRIAVTYGIMSRNLWRFMKTTTVE